MSAPGRRPHLRRGLGALLAALLGLAVPAAAQRPVADEATVDLVLRGVPADAALAALATAARLDIVYSTALVGTQPVWCGGTDGRAEAVLRCITDAVGLDYVRRSSGTYVVTERVVEAPPPGAVAGLVVDAATGEPLPLAHVRLAGTTAVADADGRFSVGALPPGPYVLTATFVGYAPQAARVTVAPGGVARETVALQPAVTTAGTVVVDALQARFASEVLGADPAAGPVAVPPAERPHEDADDAPGTGLADQAPAPTSSVAGAGLRLLLGVSERTFRDGLSLQGGEVGEHVLQIDGATVYEPLAIGPTLGALSPLAIGRVTVRKAGFGARHGSHLAGVLQAEHALARPADGAPLALAAEADAYAAGGRLQHHTRLGTWGNTPVEATTLIAVRRSLWDVRAPGALGRTLREWNTVDPVLAAALDGTAPRPRYDVHRHGSDVAFSDVHAATRLRAGALRSLRASLYHGAASVGTELFAQGAPHAGADPTVPDAAALLLARDGTRWANLAATLRGDALVSARWRVGASARLSHHTLRQRYDTATGTDAGLTGTESVADAEARLAATLAARDAAGNGNRLTEAGVGADATLALARGHEVAVGLDMAVLDSRFHLLSDGYGAAAFRDVDAAGTHVRGSAFVESTHRLGARWALEPSVRLTALAVAGDVIAEPRLAARYDAMPGDRLLGVPLSGVAARVAAGVYRQFVSRVELATFGPSALVPSVAVWLPTDGSVPPPSALHAAAEVLWQPSDAWAARVEGYAKALPHVYALDYPALLAVAPDAPPLRRQADLLLHEEGRARGVGLRVERQAPRWAASAGVAWAQTARRSATRFEGRWVPAPWAEPLRATLGVDWLAAGRRDATGLLVRLRGLGVWGRAWAFRRAYYDVLPATGTTTLGGFAFDRPEDDRLPPRLTLDVGVAYTQALGGGRRLELAADVTNVLDHRDVLDWWLHPAADGSLQPVTRALPGIQPSLRLRVAL